MFKDIPGYEGKYMINECGNIIKHNTEINLGPYKGFKIRKVRPIYKLVNNDK